MYLVLSLIFLLIAAWLVWVPVREYRHAQAAGAPRLPFSRMLMRLVVAGCVLAIVLFLFLALRPSPDRSALAELLYLSAAVLMALVMLVAGYTDYLLAKREYLIGRRALLGHIARPASPDPPDDASPSENGSSG